MALVLTSRHKVTYAELSAWPDDGRRYELYDGEVSEVPAPLPRHQLALCDQLRAHVAKQGGLVLISPIDIVFDDTNVLQPDIVRSARTRRHVHLIGSQGLLLPGGFPAGVNQRGQQLPCMIP